MKEVVKISYIQANQAPVSGSATIQNVIEKQIPIVGVEVSLTEEEVVARDPPSTLVVGGRLISLLLL